MFWNRGAEANHVLMTRPFLAQLAEAFLALLEVIRLKQVRALQPGQFGEIEIAAAA